MAKFFDDRTAKTRLSNHTGPPRRAISNYRKFLPLGRRRPIFAPLVEDARKRLPFSKHNSPNPAPVLPAGLRAQARLRLKQRPTMAMTGKRSRGLTPRERLSLEQSSSREST